MSVDFDHKYKNQVGCKIALKVSEAVKNQLIPEEEIEECCNFILTAIQTIDNQIDFMIFLERLAERWECFAPILSEEQQKNNTVQKIEENIMNRTSLPHH